MVWRGGVTRRVLLEGGIDFNREFGKVSKKKRAWQERGGENTDGVWHSKKHSKCLVPEKVYCIINCIINN